jgi:hypothetical protein
VRQFLVKKDSGSAIRQGMLIALLSGLLAIPSAYGNLTVDLRVNSQRVDLGGRIELTVTVSGTMQNVPEPDVAGIENFRVIRTSTSSQISIVNFKANISKSTIYNLIPNNVGTFTLGPVVVKVGGQSYSSNSVTVEVVQGGETAPGTGKPPAGQPAPASPQVPRSGQSVRVPQSSSSPDRNVFILGTVDKKEVYLGEQVTYTFGFYNRLRLAENPGYTPPTFNGFWVETLDNTARQSTKQVNGIVYSVQELRYALFPTITGEAKITGAGLSYLITNIWDFFSRGQQISLETEPVVIKVKPLPEEGRPASFSGTVGKFTVNAGFDKNAVKQGEAVTLELTVAGAGNLKTIQAPSLPEMANLDIDIYESKSEESIDRTGDIIKGRKVFKYVLVPRKEGEYRWPGISFSYFDPEEKKYYTLKTSDLVLNVQPGEKEQQTTTYRVSPESVVAVGEDIHYIKENSESLQAAGSPLSGSGLFWLLHLVPLVSIGAGFLYRRHRGRLSSDLGYARLRGARKRLSRHLKEASKAISAGNWAQAYAAMDRALIHFLGDKLNVETVGMVTEGIDELLAGMNINQELRREVRECLDHFAYVRFATQAGADQQTARKYLKKVTGIADRFDRAL